MDFDFKQEFIFEIKMSAEKELSKVVAEIEKYLKPQSLFLLSGDLAAGKTTLVKALFPDLDIVSPTFSIRNSYTDQKKMNIEHLDLYRLETEDDIESVGLWDIFSNQNSMVFIEWPQRVSVDHWPIDWDKYNLQILISEENSSERVIRLNKILPRLV
jgi:tRNA threonylcarbamoyladenosine biosynthesis protein TsaE